MTVTCIIDISLLPPSSNRAREKIVNSGYRLEIEADSSLPYTANIRKVWKPISIHTPLQYNVYGSARTFCKVTTLPVHNGVVREHNQVRCSKLLYSQSNVRYFICCRRENWSKYKNTGPGYLQVRCYPCGFCTSGLRCDHFICFVAARVGQHGGSL